MARAQAGIGLRSKCSGVNQALPADFHGARSGRRQLSRRALEQGTSSRFHPAWCAIPNKAANFRIVDSIAVIARAGSGPRHPDPPRRSCCAERGSFYSNRKLHFVAPDICCRKPPAEARSIPANSGAEPSSVSCRSNTHWNFNSFSTRRVSILSTASKDFPSFPTIPGLRASLKYTQKCQSFPSLWRSDTVYWSFVQPLVCSTYLVTIVIRTGSAGSSASAGGLAASLGALRHRDTELAATTETPIAVVAKTSFLIRFI